MTEGGFTKIPHWLMSMLYRSDLTGRELRVILYIIRDTLGYHKKSNKIAYTRISEATGIDRREVIRIISSLESKGWISVKRKAKSTNIIRFLASGVEPTSASGENAHILVGQNPPIKDNPKSDLSASHSFGECEPQGKEILSFEELNSILESEYE